MKKLPEPHNRRATQTGLVIVLTAFLFVGFGVGSVAAERLLENEAKKEKSQKIPAWFSRSSAVSALKNYARFETRMLKQALAGRNIEPLSQIPVSLTRGRLAEQHAGTTTASIISNLNRSGLNYSDASVKINVRSISNRPPRYFSSTRRASNQAWWPQSSDGQYVYVRYRRVATLQIDLTGATNIQGFDPADGLATVSSDEFLAVFLNRVDGRSKLFDIAWLVSEDKGYTDRPLGWLGTETLVVKRSSSRGPSSRTRSSMNARNPDSVDEFLEGVQSSVPEVSNRAQKSRRVGLNGAQKQAVVDYARRYAKNPNRDFKYFGNDCTNFVSQALQAGGWRTVSRRGIRTDVQKDLNLWFYRHMTWFYPESAEWASYTWTGVDEWYHFARNVTGRTSRRGNIWWYVPGEILQANIDAQGDIDHSMVVTGKWVDSSGRTQIVLSYHTNNRLDKSIRDLLAAWPDAWWYGHRT